MSRFSTGRSRPDASVAVDRPAVPAEIVFLCVVLVLTIFFSLAGVPGVADPVAGDGSDNLRKGWMEHQQAVQAEQTAGGTGMTPPPSAQGRPVRGRPEGPQATGKPR